MLNKKVRTIRSSLATLVGICVVPVILLMLWLLWNSYWQKEHELIKESQVDARALSAIVDQEFASVQQALFTLASSPLLRETELSGFYAQSKVVAEGTGLYAIILFDAQAMPLMHTLYPLGQVQPNPAFRTHIEEVLQTGKPVTSVMFAGPIVKEYLIHIAIPVSGGKGASRVLVGVLPAEHFQKIIEKYVPASKKIFAIFDKDNTVVALSGATQTIEQVRGKKINPGLVEALRSSDEGTIQTVNLQDQETLNSFNRSRTSGWGTSIAIPRQLLLADLRQSAWRLLGLSVLILGISLAAAWAIGGRIAAAVQALRGPARELGAGNVVVVPEQSLAVREAKEVAQSLVKASETLADANALLVISEARMRSILESAMDAIITVDATHRIVLFNRAASNMFRYKAEQAMGMSMQELLVDWSDNVMDSVGKATGLRLGGESFPAELTISVAQEADMQLFTLIIRDVSDQVRARVALERSNHDLKQFAFVASHDLKTPLRSIGGFVQMLAKSHANVFDANANALVERTLSAVKRLEHLTEDLLRYAQIDVVALSPLPVEMSDVAHEVISLLDASITQTKGTVTLDKLPVVIGNRTQLVQLLLNLIGNGLKYCRGHAPEVHLGAVWQDGTWVFSVTDNGIGIDDQHYEKVFEVFKRLHSQSEFAGTGIGLAVCKRIVDAHGGRIWVTSEPGSGSTFSFTLKS